MKKFRQDGVNISDMESKIKDNIKNNIAQIKEILQPLFEVNGKGFDQVIQDKLKNWFVSCGITPKEYTFGSTKFNVGSFIYNRTGFEFVRSGRFVDFFNAQWSP